MRHTDHLAPNAARRIHELIRVVPDFPKKGIQFRDVMPAVADPSAFHLIVEAMCAPHLARRPDAVLGVEARGFIFGAAMAQRLGIAFVPARKAGKLPGPIDGVEYALEYGTASIELQQGALKRGWRVAIVDDLLATGGTAKAAAVLVAMQHAEVTSFDFVIALDALGGERAIVSADPLNALADFNAVITY